MYHTHLSLLLYDSGYQFMSTLYVHTILQGIYDVTITLYNKPSMLGPVTVTLHFTLGKEGRMKVMNKRYEVMNE
jgi:hypothetical protein